MRVEATAHKRQVRAVRWLPATIRQIGRDSLSPARPIPTAGVGRVSFVDGHNDSHGTQRPSMPEVLTIPTARGATGLVKFILSKMSYIDCVGSVTSFYRRSAQMAPKRDSTSSATTCPSLVRSMISRSLTDTHLHNPSWLSQFRDCSISLIEVEAA